ncbi:hypothetical protein L9F63_006551 [Diploptera punctata]|uniref:Chitin-binding type-2 domain-containing protein n=1 Tax=Diploptera punctata TaxID=6984 RepID=A0AAD8E4F2_DIPPU|nr:hypothetical protein L9F63_006551 [Diploptera punctata]
MSFDFVSGCFCTLSTTNAESNLEEKENGTSTSESPQTLKTEQKSEIRSEDGTTHIRKYRRPHIERVWIMKPNYSNTTSGNNRFNMNFSDPIRSFASAIKDPETFVRYLKQEERQELSKHSSQHLSFLNRTLPNSKFVQMEIFSQSSNENKIPILNVIVEQDDYDKIDSRAFMDLMKEVASIPWGSNSTSDVIHRKDIEFKRGLQQYRTEQLQRSQSITSETSQESGLQYREIYDSNSNKNINNQSEKNQKDVLIQNSSEAKRSGREHHRRKTRKRQRERQFRQKLSTAEPLIVLGEFGQRTRNYTRSSLEFNRSKSHDILMAPSTYLLPPAESNFRHYNLPQNVATFTQAPIPVPRERHSLRRRKRPRPPHSRTIGNELVTEAPRISTDSSHTHQPVIITPITQDTAVLTTDIPRRSTDTYHYSSTELSSPEIDPSRIHFEAPSNHSSTTHSSVPNYPSSTSQPPTERIAVHQQPSSLVLPPDDTSQYQNTLEVDNESSSNEGGTNSQERQNIVSASLKGVYRSEVGYIEPRYVLPPSTNLSPPEIESLNNEYPYNAERRIAYSEEQYSQSDFLVTATPNVNNFPNEEQNLQSSSRINTVTQKEPLTRQNVSRTSNRQSNFDSLPQHVKNNYSSLMAVIVDMFGDGDYGFRSNHSYSTNERTQKQNQPRRRPKGRDDREDEYDELQLTAAETAYYRRRQLTQRPYALFENTDSGSIPGVPGKDYPIYNRPPKTNFVCIRGQGGYFADVSTRCQVFFVCSEDGRGEPMMCPNGTLFNQDYLVCDWWYNVACAGVPSIL